MTKTKTKTTTVWSSVHEIETLRTQLEERDTTISQLREEVARILAARNGAFGFADGLMGTFMNREKCAGQHYDMGRDDGVTAARARGQRLKLVFAEGFRDALNTAAVILKAMGASHEASPVGESARTALWMAGRALVLLPVPPPPFARDGEPPSVDPFDKVDGGVEPNDLDHLPDLRPADPFKTTDNGPAGPWSKSNG